MTNPLRIARQNLIDLADVTASSALSTLPVSNLRTEDIRELWRAASTTAWVLADLGSSKTVGVTAQIGSNLALTDTVQIRVSTVDATGAAGDAYDSGVIAAAVDPVYGMLVHPIEPAVSGRYLRIDMTQAETVEAGRWMAAPVFSPTRDRSFGAATIWRDPSRRIESLGQATLIDRKLRQRGLGFTLTGLTVAEAAELEAINRENGTSKDILIVTDINSANLGKASLWGLLEVPIEYPQTDRDFVVANFEVWERL